MVSPASGFFGPRGSAKKSDDSGEQPSDYPLGTWSNGKFSFHSPAAEERWRRDAVDSGVHYQAWDQGRKLNEKRRQLVEMGFAPRADIYRGPDGEYYHMTPAAREDPQVTAMRRVALNDDKRSGDIGELAKRANTRIAPEALAHIAKQAPILGAPPAAAANDNRSTANDNKPKPFGTGRFATMAQALKAAGPAPTLGEIGRAVDDTFRLAANNFTADTADNIAAGGNALSALVTDETYGDTYRVHFAEEQAKTEAARKRLGLFGVGVDLVASPGTDHRRCLWPGARSAHVCRRPEITDPAEHWRHAYGCHSWDSIGCWELAQGQACIGGSCRSR
jgi:hypothetical protein